MRLGMSKSKNALSLYVIKSTYENKKHSTRIVEKLGTYEEIVKRVGCTDPIEWAKGYIETLNKKEKENKLEVLVKYVPSEQIPKGEQRLFNGGYLFLQKIYHELGLEQLCKEITKRYEFDYNLNAIVSRLLYSRIIYPSSKHLTCQLSENFLEAPDFQLQHIYRALEVLAKETDLIQSTLYTNSLKMMKRKTGVIYYDCTNYFFEIEQEAGLAQYGISKEHRPNPIVQMGLFMDGDGIPLAFTIQPGNTNEQLTLQPLEKKLLADFHLSKFVVCTDAGLASCANRKFNDRDDRAFITTQSLKKLRAPLREWALEAKGWHVCGESKSYDLGKLPDDQNKDTTFYKEQWITDDGLKQKLIVTYSLKYRDYQRQIRNSQIERAQKAIEKHPPKLGKAGANDYKRFIQTSHCTKEGEVASKRVYDLDLAMIEREEAYDGFYAVCTNLASTATEIIQVNQRRWEIEECFRIMKSEFKARPIYLSRDDRIKAHFTTCFMALMLYRLLEKRLDSQFTCQQIISGLRNMNFLKIEHEGYVPSYTRNDFTDALHAAFGFRTDYQILKASTLKKIFKFTNP